MPDPSTTRLALYKSKSDGSELVTYAQDIGGNWDKVDLAVGFQSATSTTRPSAPYSGKPIFQTDTANSTFFHNGSSPASGGWVELPNSSSTFGSNLKLAAGAQLVIGADVNLFRSAANVLRTDDALVVGGALTASSTLAVTGNTTVGGNATITGDLKLGSNIFRNQFAISTAVANTTTETVIGSLTIPANDAVVGAIYRITVFGTASVTGTPQFTIRGRLGGATGTLAATLGPTTAGSGVTNQTWSVDFDLICLTTGASATWMPRFILAQNVSTASAQTGSVLLPTSGAPLTQDSTVSNAMVVTWTWSAASASNTATARAIAYRIA